MRENPLTVLVAGVQSLYFAGLQLLLSQEPDFKVHVTADHGQDLLKTVKRLQPAVVLFSPPPGQDLYGQLMVSQTQSISPTSKVLVLVDEPSYRNEALLLSLLQAGAKGYLAVTSSPPMLLKAIRAIASGELWTERRLMSPIIEALTKLPIFILDHNGTHHLSRREREVIGLVLQGLHDKEIASKLQVSPTTVKAHLKQAYRKLEVRGRQGLASRLLHSVHTTQQ